MYQHQLHSETIVSSDRINNIFIMSKSSGEVAIVRVPSPSYLDSSKNASSLPNLHVGIVSSVAFVNEGILEFITFYLSDTVSD